MGYSIFDETMVDMTWPEIEKAIQNQAIVLLPVGVIEEHGPHISLAVDIYVSYLISKIIKHDLESRNTQTLIAPPYYWGINTLTGCFPGSFNVRPETMRAVLVDTLESLKNWGVNYVFLINWHGEHSHNMAMIEAVKQVRASVGIKAYCILTDFEARSYKSNGIEDSIIIIKTPPPKKTASKYLDVHAGSLETGIMINYFPEHVKSEIAKSLEPSRITIEDLMAVKEGGNEVRRVMPYGYFGNPAGFDLEDSKRYLEDQAHDFANGIESVLKMNDRK
jgi:creatinine amidohydrolase